MRDLPCRPYHRSIDQVFLPADFIATAWQSTYSLEVSGSMRPFVRPQRAVSCETSHGGVITPGLHLRLKRIAHEPYGPRQPRILGFLYRGWSAIATRFRSAATHRFRRLKPSLPVRNLFLPFQRARLHPAKATYLGDWLDLLSLPEASLISFSLGSSFQVRYLPLGLLSHEPLGTNSSVPPNASFVNRNPTVT